MAIVDAGLCMPEVGESMEIGGLILPWQLVKPLIKNKIFVDNTEIYIWILWITILFYPRKWYEHIFIDTLIGYVSPNFSCVKITCSA